VQIKHILLATDNSKHSEKAAATGGELARALGARITILNVLNDEAVVAAAWEGPGVLYANAGGDTSIETVRSQMEKTAMEGSLASAAAAVGELGTPPKLDYAWGQAASVICEYAEQHTVDMIVLGSHGRTGIKAMLLGSVSHAVANRAPCTVTIVR